MAPSNPWTANNRPTSSINDTSFPKLKPEVKNGSKPNHYEELQEDELIVLSAMYGDDFKDTRPVTGAWKKADPSFSITVRSSDEEVFVTLEVVLTATYPRTVPLLKIKNDEKLREGTRYKLSRVIKDKPKELLEREQPMVWEIVEAIREVVEEAANAKALGLELPSLEEERAIHEAEAARAAQALKEEEEQKRQQEKLEEERVLEKMLEDELQRQKSKAKEAKMKKATASPNLTKVELAVSDDRLVFDQPITVTTTSGDECVFQVVNGKTQLRSGPVSDCFTVRPVAASGSPPFPTLVLKQTVISSSKQGTAQLRKAIQALESDLENLKKKRHRNILSIFGLHVGKNAESAGAETLTVDILCEYAEKGSLEELLEMSSLSVDKVRSWTIELLQGLKFLHEQGITHEDIHAGNVLLVRTSSGEIVVKLADGGFQNRLHTLSTKQRSSSTMAVAKSAYWLPPELASSSTAQYTQKSDVWNFGIVFVQMLFGLDVQQKYASPVALTDSLALSDSLDEIVHKFFKTDPKRRPRAWELSSSEFLATDAPILLENSLISRSSISSTDVLRIPTASRIRRESSHQMSGFSRYREDFVEESRLGRGGFGEVVKARRKLDGQLYAIKKITQKSASLTEILKEVRLLSQLNHPYVVRYFTSWTETEEMPDYMDTDNDTMTMTDMDENVSPGGEIHNEYNTSTGGLDFISSSRIPFEFGYDTDEGGSDDAESDEESDESEDTSPSALASISHSQNVVVRPARSSVRSPTHRARTTLYISMQYCEKRTLRDLIKRDLYKDNDEIWRLFREILEGLAHVHSLNVVHRDLKPENIFIDGSLDVRIGDFGLATSGQYSATDKGVLSVMQSTGDMTSSVGTPYYVAPEIRSSVSGSYNSKVDMYSLGVIFFEMCYRAVVGMERDEVLGKIRQKNPTLPQDFDLKGKSTQAAIILSLLNHNPKERPGSSELLQSGQLPVQMESETIRQTLAGLSSSSSPYYQKMMTALFSRTRDSAVEAKDFAYDLAQTPRSSADLMLQGLVKQKLTSIFRHHGAVECPRSAIFPRSGLYGADAVQLLDPNGTLVQLPYDLTLPHARMVAKHDPSVNKTFAFGNVFRDRHDGAQPQTFGEVDFDIVSSSALDLALKEAEVIKVLDEIVASFPSMSKTQMCIHLNHSDLLNLVFDFCQIDTSVRGSVAEVLSKLNIGQNTWAKIRNELRSPVINLSTMSVDDLQRFDFRDTPLKAFNRLKKMFEGTEYYEKVSSTIAHLSDVIGYVKLMHIACKVYLTPLGSLKERFYKGGTLFQVVFDGRSKDVFAAGGRYDGLIREHKPRIGANGGERHAVGFSLAWEKLSTSMSRLQKSGSKSFLKKIEEELQGIWNTRRCDVLVASFDPTILRSAGLDIVQHLWANEISAELATDSRSPEDLLSKHRDEHHSWIIIVKQDNILKVKSMLRKDVPDADINASQLTSWLRAEMREREQREGVQERAKMSKFSAQYDNTGNGEVENEQDVRVLVAQSKSKKSNRTQIRQQAQARAASLVQSFLKGPIAAIETNDHVMDQISHTRLSDPDSWRRVSQNVSMVDRRYIGEIHDLLKTLAHEYRGATRNAFVYNFKTGSCIYYDLVA